MENLGLKAHVRLGDLAAWGSSPFAYTYGIRRPTFSLKGVRNETKRARGLYHYELFDF